MPLKLPADGIWRPSETMVELQPQDIRKIGQDGNHCLVFFCTLKIETYRKWCGWMWAYDCWWVNLRKIENPTGGRWVDMGKHWNTCPLMSLLHMIVSFISIQINVDSGGMIMSKPIFNSAPGVCQSGWWLEHFFPYFGNVIIPIDELLFFRGVGRPPTG